MASRSKNAQFTIYATESNQVTIKLTNGAGTSIVAVAKGYTVVNTGSDGVPLVGITGAGGGSGFISEIIETSANTLIATAGADIIVDTPDVVLTADTSIEQEPNFIYVSNNSTGDCTFEGQHIPAGTRVGYIYSDDASDWVIFMDRGVSTPGFIQKVRELSVDTLLTSPGENIVVDTSGVVLTVAPAMEVEPNFMYINNTSSNEITFAGNTVTAGTRVAFVYSDDASDWVVFMADASSVASISHLIGFGAQVHPTDGDITEYFMDIIPLLAGVTIDASKYNLEWDGGGPAWKIVNSGVDVTTVTDVDVILNSI